MSDFAFSSEWKNRTHLSWIRPLSRSSLPSSSRAHCHSTFFVSSSCYDLMFWKNLCWSLTRNCFSNSTTWRSKQRTTAALRTFISQLHAFLTAFRSCASLVFGRICAGLSRATASPAQRRGARSKERLLHYALSSASYMSSRRPSAAAHPPCPFSGAATLRASHQSQPAVQLSFGRLHSTLAPVSFVPGVGSTIQRFA